MAENDIFARIAERKRNNTNPVNWSSLIRAMSTERNKTAQELERVDKKIDLDYALSSDDRWIKKQESRREVILESQKKINAFLDVLKVDVEMCNDACYIVSYSPSKLTVVDLEVLEEDVSSEMKCCNHDSCYCDEVLQKQYELERKVIEHDEFYDLVHGSMAVEMDFFPAKFADSEDKYVSFVVDSEFIEEGFPDIRNEDPEEMDNWLKNVLSRKKQTLRESYTVEEALSLCTKVNDDTFTTKVSLLISEVVGVYTRIMHFMKKNIYLRELRQEMLRGIYNDGCKPLLSFRGGVRTFSSGVYWMFVRKHGKIKFNVVGVLQNRLIVSVLDMVDFMYSGENDVIVGTVGRDGPCDWLLENHEMEIVSSYRVCIFSLAMRSLAIDFAGPMSAEFMYRSDIRVSDISPSTMLSVDKPYQSLVMTGIGLTGKWLVVYHKTRGIEFVGEKRSSADLTVYDLVRRACKEEVGDVECDRVRLKCVESENSRVILAFLVNIKRTVLRDRDKNIFGHMFVDPLTVKGWSSHYTSMFRQMLETKHIVV
jgi:hypothetical protein